MHVSTTHHEDTMTSPTWFKPALVLLALSTTALALQGGSPSTNTDPGSAHAPRGLRVELRANPLAIDDTRPRFSWEIDDPRRGASQSAYQVLVATSAFLLKDEKGDAWDSGRVLASDTVGIEYAGKALVPGTTYAWMVKTWDAIGKPTEWSSPASFGVGPARADAWDAQWIRAGRAPDASSIGHKSEIATAADGWPWVQFDFGGEVKCDHVRLHPARPDGDVSKPGVLFPLRVRVYTDARGKFEDKSIRIAEYVWQDIPDAGAQPLDLDLSPYSLRYLRIVATKIQPDGDRGFAMALGEVEVLDKGVNIAPRGAISVSGSSGEVGWTPSALNDGALVPTKVAEPTPESLPRLRGVFTIEAPAVHARLHATALGLYEMTVNGVRVGEDRLAPGWTDYAQRVAYQTYDIAPLLMPGENVIGVQLAPGWYAGRLGSAQMLGVKRDDALYGAEPAFLARGEIILSGGRRIAIRTDDNWRWNRSGPLLSANLVGGESRDNRNEKPGWDAPRFAGSDWRPVEIANDLKPKLFAQRAEPTRVREVHPALSAREVGPKTHVYDFGRIVTGVARIRVSAEAGAEITLRYAPAVDANGRFFDADPDANAPMDRFTLRGGVEVLEPRFTIHSFRYVEVAGFSRALELDSIEALALGDDAADIGSFTCSDDTLNRVWRAAVDSARANLVAIPTNAPQRGDRLGWLGDAGISAPFVLHAFDAAEFLGQWLSDVRAAQTKDGRFPDFAPQPFGADARFYGAPGFADAGVTVPWEIYLRTHDLRLLRSSASSAAAWVKFIASKNPDFVWRNERGNDYADWLNTSKLVVDGKPCTDCAVQPELFATACFAHSARIAAKMAFAVGDANVHKDMLEIADRAEAAFRAEFVQGGRLVGDTQAAYALALAFDLSASDAQATEFADRLAARVREQGYSTCGLPTAHLALIALSRHGHHDVALDLARRTTLPSWGHMLENGSSTTWGRWDGLVAGRDFAESGPDAFNHYAFGGIGEWMVREVAGLQLVDTHVDSGAVAIDMNSGGSKRTSSEGVAPWSRIRFAPHVGGGLTHASAEHQSIAGLVRSAWKLDGDSLAYECTIPPGSSAVLDLPAKDVDSVTLGGRPLSEVKSMQARAGSDGTVRIELASGTYSFGSKVR